jgi:hypothetical protein
MKYEMYRVVRTSNYEEWIICRYDMEEGDRVAILYEPQKTKVFLITGDSNSESDDEYMLNIQNLYHHQMDYNDYELEIIVIEYKDENGKVLKDLEANDKMNKTVSNLRKRLKVNL